MKFKELAQMTREEQEKKLSELELELIKLNAQVATGTPPKNAGQLRRLKKDIARVMLLRSTRKKLGEEAGKNKDKKGSSQKKTGIQKVKKAEDPKDRKKKPKNKNE
jgi:ribosomal protein L29